MSTYPPQGGYDSTYAPDAGAAGPSRPRPYDEGPYAPKPSHPAPGGGYGFDYNFGLSEDSHSHAHGVASQDEHLRHRDTHPHGDGGMYLSSQERPPTGSSYGYSPRPPIQRSASGASTNSKTELTTVTVKTHEFSPEYPDGWTHEDMEAEKAFLKEGMFNWKDLRDWRFWIRAKWWCE